MIRTAEELEQKVRESGSLSERLESCRARIGKMCKERRPPKMTIPVQWDDDDFFMSVTIQDAQQCVQRTVEACPVSHASYTEDDSNTYLFCPYCGERLHSR